VNRKRNLPIITNLEIIDVAAEGKSIGKADGVVVFVPFAAPGDIVDVQVVRKRKNYIEAVPVTFHKYSNQRVAPVCSHFGLCGGCKWQHLPYEMQLVYKQKQVEDQLVRIGKLSVPSVNPTLPSHNQLFYRNKLEFTFSASRWLTQDEINSGQDFDRKALGFHIPEMFDKVFNVDKCWLQSDPSNAIRDEIKAFAIEKDLSFFDLRNHTGLLRNLIIRTSGTGDIMVIVCFGENDEASIEMVLDHLAEKFPQITSLLYVVNQKQNDTITDQDVLCYRGNDHFFEEMEGLRFKIGPKSFYQTNLEQAYELYKITRNFASLKPNDVVYDLYTGTGTIANFVAKSAFKVVGIEYVPEAIEDAKVNSQINNINNTTFFAGDIKNVLTTDFIGQQGRPDVIILDPPRAGVHEDVIGAIHFASPTKIVYVSCNPASQARDLALLDDAYQITDVQPVDMFPHTQHVENVVKLVRR
jgi:23S rRNA (uracil1939-C5)-methyltransferase